MVRDAICDHVGLQGGSGEGNVCESMHATAPSFIHLCFHCIALSRPAAHVLTPMHHHSIIAAKQ